MNILKSLGVGRGKKEPTDVLNEVDLAHFIDIANELYPEYYPFFFTAARTGMRLGELLALRWGDISFNHKVIIHGGGTEERPYIYVERTYRRGIITPPKNGKPRKVDMSSQLREVLLRHRSNEKRKGLALGLGGERELEFNRDGQIIEQNYIRRVFKRILEKAGLREVKFHALRHSYASLLLSKGVSPVYAKEQLGHYSIQMTVDIYGRWIQTAAAPAVNILDDATKRNPDATNAAK